MPEARRNVLVGLFMIAGLAVLGLLMVLFGERPSWLGGAEYEVRIEFRELKGVTAGMAILLNGVQVGRVGRLEFQNPERPDLGVEVIALIKDDYFIPKLAKAVVQPGLFGLGRGQIEIIPPGVETEPLDPEIDVIFGTVGSAFGDLIPETMLTSIERATLQIGNLAEATTPLATDLHHLFELRSVQEVDDPLAAARGITANLYTVVQRLDITLRHVNDVLGDPEIRDSVKQSVRDLQQTMADARETAAVLRRAATRLEEDLPGIAERLDAGLADANAGINEIRKLLVPTLDTASKLMDNLNRVARDLAEGEGTGGLLLRDERLYEALVLSAERITDAVDTLRRILQRSEEQGHIDLKLHEAVGPFPYDKRIDIPPARK